MMAQEYLLPVMMAFERAATERLLDFFTAYPIMETAGSMQQDILKFTAASRCPT